MNIFIINNEHLCQPKKFEIFIRISTKIMKTQSNKIKSNQKQTNKIKPNQNQEYNLSNNHNFNIHFYFMS